MYRAGEYIVQLEVHTVVDKVLATKLLALTPEYRLALAQEVDFAYAITLLRVETVEFDNALRIASRVVEAEGVDHGSALVLVDIHKRRVALAIVRRV